jgi:hypothetical protein
MGRLFSFLVETKKLQKRAVPASGQVLFSTEVRFTNDDEPIETSVARDQLLVRENGPHMLWRQASLCRGRGTIVEDSGIAAAWGLCTAPLGLFSSARVSSTYIRVSSLPQKTSSPHSSRLPCRSMLGSQTATFGTSGTIKRAVAEDKRQWRKQPVTASLTGYKISRLGVS